MEKELTTQTNIEEMFEILKKPLPPEDIEWRIGRKSRDGRKASVLAYTTARGVMNRLDEAVGCGNWQINFDPIDMGTAGKTDRMGNAIDLKGFKCTMTITVLDHNGEPQWITRADVAHCTDIEPIKGGASGAMKRVATQFGIGRYLYDLESIWVDIDENGRFTPPQLPKWALPEGYVYPEPKKSYKEAKAELAEEKKQYDDGAWRQVPNVKDEFSAESQADPIINFGKHNGKHYSEVPRAYVEWMASNIKKDNVREQAITWLASNPVATPAMDEVPW